MGVKSDKSFQNLTSRIGEFREMESSPERHLFMLWLVTRAMSLLDGDRPVLVGGGAVEFYTATRFSTGDLDLVASEKKKLKKALIYLGFDQQSGDRHFINREVGAMIELHSSRLRPGEEPVELVYRKTPLLVVSPEDCITERLASYRKHGSTVDLLNAFMISYHQKDRIDIERMTDRIGQMDLWDYYRPLQDINRSLVINHIGVDEAAMSLLHFMKKGSKECAF